MPICRCPACSSPFVTGPRRNRGPSAVSPMQNRGPLCSGPIQDEDRAEPIDVLARRQIEGFERNTREDR